MKPLVLLTVLLVSCGGAQRPLTWDVGALASVHGVAHGLTLLDDGAAAYYRTRTDALAADGGPDGSPLRGAAYLIATASIDAGYAALVRDMSVTRDALVLAEATVRQAAAIADTPTRCRAFVAVASIVDDIALVERDASGLGVPVDTGLVGSTHDLDAISASLAAGCIGPILTDAGVDEISDGAANE